MKRIFLSLLFVLFAAAGLHAQDVQITNISGCDVTARAVYGFAPCAVVGTLPPAFIPNGTATPPIYLSAPGGMIILYVEILDCSGTVIGILAPPSTAGCGFSTSTATPSFSTGCGPCSAGSVINAVGTDNCSSCPTGGWVLEIY